MQYNIIKNKDKLKTAETYMKYLEKVLATDLFTVEESDEIEVDMESLKQVIAELEKEYYLSILLYDGDFFSEIKDEVHKINSKRR